MRRVVVVLLVIVLAVVPGCQSKQAIAESKLEARMAELRNTIVPQEIQYMADNLFLIMHSTDIQKCVVVNAGIANVPTNGLCISFGFALETMFYK
jgi:hypothetical protein